MSKCLAAQDTLLQHSTAKSILKRHDALVASLLAVKLSVYVLVQLQFQFATRYFFLILVSLRQRTQWRFMGNLPVLLLRSGLPQRNQNEIQFLIFKNRSTKTQIIS